MENLMEFILLAMLLCLAFTWFESTPIVMPGMETEVKSKSKSKFDSNDDFKPNFNKKSGMKMTDSKVIGSDPYASIKQKFHVQNSGNLPRPSVDFDDDSPYQTKQFPF